MHEYVADFPMPTLHRHHRWRFFFYSNEGNEPPHVHVETPSGECKFWLTPVRLARARGVSSRELARVRIVVEERAAEFRRSWYAYFD